MILGLDISTSITGYTILNDNGKVIENDAWDMRNKRYFADIFEKAAFAKDNLKDIQSRHTIKDIYIEKSLQSFRSGFSSAKTLSTLSSFNGTLSWMCYEIFGIKPEFIAATTARKLCGIKVPKGKKAKQVVLEFLLDNEPSFVISYTSAGNPKPSAYDRADSMVIAKAGLCKKLENMVL